VAIKPDGGERWRRKIDESILTTPAVDPATGDIFVVGQSHSELGTKSRIFHLNSSAGLPMISTTDFFTPAAPKLWRNFIFIPAIMPGDDDANTLLVFDQATLVPVGQIKAACFDLVCGGGVNPIGALSLIGHTILEGVECAVTFESLDFCGYHTPLGPQSMPSV